LHLHKDSGCFRSIQRKPEIDVCDSLGRFIANLHNPLTKRSTFAMFVSLERRYAYRVASEQKVKFSFFGVSRKTTNEQRSHLDKIKLSWQQTLKCPS